MRQKLINSTKRVIRDKEKQTIERPILEIKRESNRFLLTALSKKRKLDQKEMEITAY
jgi:hypothetical protein